MAVRNDSKKQLEELKTKHQKALQKLVLLKQKDEENNKKELEMQSQIKSLKESTARLIDINKTLQNPESV